MTSTPPPPCAFDIGLRTPANGLRYALRNVFLSEAAIRRVRAGRDGRWGSPCILPTRRIRRGAPGRDHAAGEEIRKRHRLRHRRANDWVKGTLEDLFRSQRGVFRRARPSRPARGLRPTKLGNGDRGRAGVRKPEHLRPHSRLLAAAHHGSKLIVRGAYSISGTRPTGVLSDRAAKALHAKMLASDIIRFH